MKKTALCAMAFYLSVCLALSPALADQHAKKTMPVGDTAAQAMMQDMMKKTMPGAHHKVLDVLVGIWDYTVTFKMSPDAPAQTSKGTSDNQWIMDGRFVEQKISGSMDVHGKTMPYKGLGFIGYDNIKGKYVSSWMDNMNTGMMTGVGTYDAENKTLTERGTYSCPMKGPSSAFESTLQIVDNDHLTFTMYDIDKDEKRFQSMELKYTRKK